ncbi:Spy/CpxP family protein refolding chaperone [Neptunicella sp.]|uniref:Spy/CpxP family protein refolding chaperone n=1 Tax=Neptunicella sp. TaxID=2125986 RepID=UPI003F69340A
MQQIKVLPKFIKPITSLLLVAALFSQPVLAHPDGGKPAGLRGVLSQLALTTEQRQAIHELVKQGRESGHEYWQDRYRVGEQLKSLIQSDRFDQTAITELFNSDMQQKTQKQWQKAQMLHSIWSQLTEQQKQKWADLAEERDFFVELHHRDEPRLGRLELSDAQKQQIKLLRGDMQAISETFHSEMQVIKQQQRALITSEQLNEQEWQRLQQQSVPKMVAFAVARAENKHNIWQVLTPQQQQKLQQRMEHRQQNGYQQPHHRLFS